MLSCGAHTTQEGNGESDSTDDADDDEGVKDEIYGLRDDLLVVCQKPRPHGHRSESA